MQFSDSYLSLLREFKGFYANPYLYAAGVCTIECGAKLEAHRKFISYHEIAHNKRHKDSDFSDSLKKKGMKWPRSTAEAAMLDELQNTHTELLRKCKVYLILRENPTLYGPNASWTWPTTWV